MVGKPNKYHAKRTEYAGVTYDSKAEAIRAKQLDLLKRAGEIAAWARQWLFILGPDWKWSADFVVTDTSGKLWAEEVKGCETANWKTVKNRLWCKYGPCPLVVLKLKRNGRDWDRTIIDGKAVDA